ncbi:symmetrical bis(5'-nucleosyl)-tetraphosphatase [Dichelobacter nodosus]|uniref:bis(5'-nucleosyl)-tetraphosphatase (symmetrical) n=1 Tax=Dichelobacter nodosus (strain VCS1703A) TaxID=246195 RepID=A5EX64_DICNV|nr:symmetrical bis(5'-nucleosyl)-tetraphosphatase [Dichelobacter nodosus]ABQ13605.1 diadenosine tetraphosphatase [Dichelobacter nodosus VCS1703A]AXM46047.1 symmetrical bis(5'-nucleosyl)-tetraphosphatase [Dichelobacter nodosus]KNZ38982.1 hypothetical protein AKG33_06430 [Dichelobacter nodosus]TGA64783.1 symmetrical bis(5'-nucleosyl)-tetraphosphatase [Dichelobacter nodosus]
MATYVIGDVHGHYTALMRLLDKIHFSEGSDELWFLGDLINKGPDSLAVVRFVSQLDPARHKVVMGNHDFSLLVQAAYPSLQMKASTAEFLHAADGADLLAKMRQWPLMFVDFARKIIVSHAGLYPNWTVEQALSLHGEILEHLRGAAGDEFLWQVYQDEPLMWSDNLNKLEQYRFMVNTLTRMRFFRKKNGAHDWTAKMPPDEAPKDLIPWYELKRRDGYRCIFGHWAALGLKIRESWACLDDGAAWGGRIAAFDVDKWAVSATQTVRL